MIAPRIEVYLDLMGERTNSRLRKLGLLTACQSPIDSLQSYRSISLQACPFRSRFHSPHIWTGARGRHRARYIELRQYVTVLAQVNPSLEAKPERDVRAHADVWTNANGAPGTPGQQKSPYGIGYPLQDAWVFPASRSKCLPYARVQVDTCGVTHAVFETTDGQLTLAT